MPTFDFTTVEPDEPILLKLGKGKDQVTINLTFIPPQNAWDTVMFVKNSRDKVKEEELTETELMAGAVAIASRGLVTPHPVDSEWILKSVELGPLMKVYNLIYRTANGQTVTEKNE